MKNAHKNKNKLPDFSSLAVKNNFPGFCYKCFFWASPENSRHLVNFFYKRGDNKCKKVWLLPGKANTFD